MNFTFNKEIPSVLMPVIHERIEFIRPYLPGWVEEVNIFFITENPDGNELSCNPQYDYRFLQIHIYPPFLDSTDWKQALLHETQHAIFRPFSEKVERILNSFVIDEPLKSFLKQEIQAAEESVAQDQSYLLRKVLDRSVPI